MFDHPLNLQSAYSSTFYVNFHSKMPKKQYLCVHWQKNSTESLKNSTDVSARFSNYVEEWWWCQRNSLIVVIVSVEFIFLLFAFCWLTGEKSWIFLFCVLNNPQNNPHLILGFVWRFSAESSQIKQNSILISSKER